MLDALVAKVREVGRVANTCVAQVSASTRDGRRETLGLDVVTAEDESSWTHFLRSLVARGLGRVQLVTSHCHAGRVEAIRRRDVVGIVPRRAAATPRSYATLTTPAFR